MRWIFSNPDTRKKINANRAEYSYPNVPISGTWRNNKERIKTMIKERE